MDNFTLLPPKVKIWKIPSHFNGFFISPEWHLCSLIIDHCSIMWSHSHVFYFPSIAHYTLFLDTGSLHGGHIYKHTVLPNVNTTTPN